jgi:RNA polymerase sigma factor (sigma-70 family)
LHFFLNSFKTIVNSTNFSVHAFENLEKMLQQKLFKTEADLIQGICSISNDSQLAEKALFQRYEYLINIGQYKHQLSEERVFDAYHDTFMVVLNDIRKQKFRGESTLKTYFSRIFNNKCIDYFRKNTTTKSRVHTWTDDLEKVSNHEAGQNIQKYLEQTELLDDLKAELRKLGAACQQIILDYAFGYSFAEIAVRLTPAMKNAQTVKSKKSQCMKKLMQQIQ